MSRHSARRYGEGKTGGGTSFTRAGCRDLMQGAASKAAAERGINAGDAENSRSTVVRSKAGGLLGRN